MIRRQLNREYVISKTFQYYMLIDLYGRRNKYVSVTSIVVFRMNLDKNEWFERNSNPLGNVRAQVWRYIKNETG